MGVAVSDISRSILFYEHLGFKSRFNVERGPETFVGKIVGYPRASMRVAMLDGHGTTIELIKYLSPPPHERLPGEEIARYEPGQQHFCLDATPALWLLMQRHARLAGALVTIPDGPQAGARVAYFLGPDNEVIELFEAAA